MYERRKASERKTIWLKEYAAQSVAAFGAIETVRIKMTVLKSESVKLDKDFLTADYMRCKTTWEPDKTLIKEQLKQGKEVQGAVLEVKTKLTDKVR